MHTTKNRPCVRVSVVRCWKNKQCSRPTGAAPRRADTTQCSCKPPRTPHCNVGHRWPASGLGWNKKRCFLQRSASSPATLKEGARGMYARWRARALLLPCYCIAASPGALFIFPTPVENLRFPSHAALNRRISTPLARNACEHLHFLVGPMPSSQPEPLDTLRCP